jgi:uncharacterized protein YbcI
VETSGPRDPAEPDAHPPPSHSVAAIEAEICREVLAIHIESYSRAPAKVRAHLWDDTVIVLLEGLELQPNEEFLIAEGHPEDVTALRNRFQQSISANFEAVVERATGRRVVGFLSQQHVDEPKFGVEVFRLGSARTG